MSAKLKKVFGAILGLVIVGAVGYGSWLLIGAFVASISEASAEVAAAIVGAMATVLVGISAVLMSQAHERRRASEEAHRLKKVEIYQGFIDIISRLIGASNEHLAVKKPDAPELVSYLFKFKSDILLWGSPRVIQAQIDFETISGNGDVNALFKAVNELYLAIREDIGLSNAGLRDLDLVKLYLNKDARAQLK